MKNQLLVLLTGLCILCLSNFAMAQPDWTNYTLVGTYQGHKYYLSNFTTNPSNAYTLAEANCAYLASITTQEEQDYIASMTGNSGWITFGLNDLVTEGSYEWHSGELFSYSNWAGGEPNNSLNEDYAHLNRYASSSFGWNDYSDGWVEKFLVEFADADNDGYADACDGCPNDENKTTPGACGCGIADTDTDGDGVADCNDNCIETANLGQEDGDGDSIGDVCDACPTVPDPDCSSCGNGKYLVCHIPAGNPENAQQLCIPYNAALTHVGNHGGCFWGACNASMTVVGNQAPTTLKEQQDNITDRAQNDGSPVVETASGATYYFEMSPNPATSTLNVHLHGHADGSYLIIHDALGRVTLHQVVAAEESSFILSLQDDRFANGRYFVTLVTNNERITRQLVIAK